MAKRPRIGDIIEIPTQRGLAYAQYALRDPLMGAMIRVMPEFFSHRPKDFSHTIEMPPRFITFFPIGAAVARGVFEIVDSVPVPVSAQQMPLFRAAGHIDRRGRVHDWWLWDGKKEWRIGRLHAEHRNLPVKEIINDTLLVERIQEGWTPEIQAQLEQARGKGDAPPWAGLGSAIRRFFDRPT